MKKYYIKYSMELLFKKNLDYYNNIEEQKKYDLYLRMFYNEKEKCPLDTKEELIRKIEGNKISLSCEKKNWNVILKLPETINFEIDLENKKNIRNNILYNLRSNISNIGFEGIVSNNLDKDINKYTEEYKKINEEILDMEKVIILQGKEIEPYLIENMELIKKLSNLKINKQKIYKKIDLNKITPVIKNDLMTIFMNENNINQTRIVQIANQKKIEVDVVKYFFEWCNLSKEYIELNSNLIKNKIKINELNILFKLINDNFYIRLPEIEEKGEKIDMKDKKKIKLKKIKK
jgi:hypothetical protein